MSILMWIITLIYGVTLYIVVVNMMKLSNRLYRGEDDMVRFKKVRKQQYEEMQIDLNCKIDTKVEGLRDDINHDLAIICPEKKCKKACKMESGRNISDLAISVKCERNGCLEEKGKNKYWCSKDCQLTDKSK